MVESRSVNNVKETNARTNTHNTHNTHFMYELHATLSDRVCVQEKKKKKKKKKNNVVVCAPHIVMYRLNLNYTHFTINSFGCSM